MATADVSYVPGALTAVVGDQCWALVAIPADAPAVARIWRQLGRGAAADALLAGLLADGADDIPGFTVLMAQADGRHRLFCRGTVGAAIVTGSAGGVAPSGDTAAGDGQAALVRVDGAGLLTWREQVVEGAERIFLGDPPADTAMRLPATSGVLLASCVVVDRPDVAALERTTPYFPDTITVTHPGGADVPSAVGPARPGSRPPATPAAPTVPFSTSQQGPPAVPGRPGGPAPSLPSPALGGPALAKADGSPDGAAGDGEYDFLWGATQARSVEGAAVRDAGRRDQVAPSHLAASDATAARPRPALPRPPMIGELRSSPSAHDGLPIDLAPPSGPPSGAFAPPSGLAPARPPRPPGGLIDAPDWLSGASAPGLAWGTPPSPAPGWEASVQPSAAPPVSAPRGASGPPVNRGELPEIITMTAPPDRIGPVVPALICPRGHVNPPNGTACRRCGAPLPHDPVPVPRPVLGVLRLSLGDLITLDRGVLMGRNPRTDFSGADGAERPHVVKLPSADGDISRTHLKVTLDGWHVLVTDLNSTNGTLVTLPGRDPQQLRPGEPMPIQPGTVVTLAEGIDFRYEVTN